METQSPFEQRSMPRNVRKLGSLKKKQKWGNRWNISIEEVLFYQNVRKTIEIKLRKMIKKRTDEAEFQVKGRLPKADKVWRIHPPGVQSFLHRRPRTPPFPHLSFLCFHSQDCYPIFNLFFYIYLCISKTQI